MARHKDANWNLHEPVSTWDEIKVAVLMDLRDELKKLNGTLQCYRFQGIPNTLDRIARNTIKPRKKRKAKK
jgi:hypothetical protein